MACVQMDIHIHDQSVIETRQRKATTPEDSSYFRKKKGLPQAGLEPMTSCMYVCMPSGFHTGGVGHPGIPLPPSHSPRLINGSTCVIISVYV